MNMRVLKYLFINEWRELFPNFLALGAFLSGAFIETVTYWYTSEAFGEHFKFANLEMSYFQFIILGECLILVPAAIATKGIHSLQNAQANGYLDLIWTSPRSHLPLFLENSLAGTFKQFLFIFSLLLLSSFLFGITLPFTAYLKLFLIILCYAPLAFFLGLIFASLFIGFGRGAGSVEHLLFILKIISGVYFPTQVFPELVQETSDWVNPFNGLLEFGRAFIIGSSENYIPLAPSAWTSLSIWSVSSALVSLPLYQWMRIKMKNRGKLEIFR